ncbi:DUF3087 domain-containing protein [Cellvibrio sp. UBA7661]|uniref:DUF3087 domain-containing protein n=1 Tax=Cellvibrio sp. UBA7661 TaxID=1946311 RepID=UPI002F35FCD4
MQLINIDKTRYRKHLKIVFIGCAVSLAVGSLALSQTLIAIFPDESGSHFHWNLLGVIISAITIGWLLNKYRQHDFMREVTYVWELKQALNKITRKMRKLEAAALNGDRNAMLAMQYSYAGSRLVWQLDDNTLTLDALAIKQHELDHLAEKFGITLSVNDYDEKILAAF